jgi:hypothetical protein
MTQDFIPPEGFLPSFEFRARRRTSREGKRRAKFAFQNRHFTPFSELPRRVRRAKTVAMGWRIRNDIDSQGLFITHTVLPGSRQWPIDLKRGEGVSHAATVRFLPTTVRQPAYFFNANLITLASVWAQAIVAHVEKIIEETLSPEDLEHSQLRYFLKPLPGGGSQMITAPNIGLASLGGLTVKGAQAKWLRSHWGELATLVSVGEKAEFQPGYQSGQGLDLITAERNLSVEAVCRAIKAFRDRGEAAYENVSADFETQRDLIEAMLKTHLWRWDSCEAKSRGDGAPLPIDDDARRLFDYQSSAIRI